MTEYTVQKGDNLYEIAKKFATTVEKIKSLNNLTSNLLTIGQVLKIPSDNTSITYIVQNGDTLYGIARQFGTTIDDIKRLNNLSSNTLIVGQALTIEEDNNPVTYTVQKGDNLYEIAKKFNTSVSNLMKLNNLSNSSLQVGQVLELVENNTNNNSDEVILMPIYENYTVQKGDNLYSIVKKFATTVEQVMKDNNLMSDSLDIGQVLKIKVGEKIFGIEECYGEGYEDLGTHYLTHTVKEKDNLYSIAGNYNTTIDNIMKLNNLKNTNLTIGQVLKVKEVDS